MPDGETPTKCTKREPFSTGSKLKKILVRKITNGLKSKAFYK